MASSSPVQVVVSSAYSPPRLLHSFSVACQYIPAKETKGEWPAVTGERILEIPQVSVAVTVLPEKTQVSVAVAVLPEILQVSVAVTVLPEKTQVSVAVTVLPEILQVSVAVTVLPEKPRFSAAVTVLPEILQVSVAVTVLPETLQVSVAVIKPNIPSRRKKLRFLWPLSSLTFLPGKKQKTKYVAVIKPNIPSRQLWPL